MSIWTIGASLHVSCGLCRSLTDACVKAMPFFHVRMRAGRTRWRIKGGGYLEDEMSEEKKSTKELWQEFGEALAERERAAREIGACETWFYRSLCIFLAMVVIVLIVLIFYLLASR